MEHHGSLFPGLFHVDEPLVFGAPESELKIQQLFNERTVHKNIDIVQDPVGAGA